MLNFLSGVLEGWLVFSRTSLEAVETEPVAVAREGGTGGLILPSAALTEDFRDPISS